MFCSIIIVSSREDYELEKREFCCRTSKAFYTPPPLPHAQSINATHTKNADYSLK